MSGNFLRVQAFVTAATLSIAMLLFAAQRHDLKGAQQFRAVVDLSASTALKVDLASSKTTIMVSPAQRGGAWTVDQLPALRLVAPLAVIEAQKKNFAGSEKLVTMDDVALWERTHGPVPQGALVLLTSKATSSPVFSSDALHFLAEARNIVGIASSGAEIVGGAEDRYLATKGIYELDNVAHADEVPAAGAIAMAAPAKIEGATAAPARLMALVH
jgi:hypothetical protein